EPAGPVLPVAPDAPPMPPASARSVRRGVRAGAAVLGLRVTAALVVVALQSIRERPSDPIEGERLATADGARLDGPAGALAPSDTLRAEAVSDEPAEEPVDEEPRSEERRVGKGWTCRRS